MKSIPPLLPALLLAALSAPAQDFRLVDLGALIDPQSYALAINQRGQVAGYGRTETGARAFLYSGGVITDLGPLGGTNSYGTSINLLGHVAGFSDLTNGPRAFVFRDGVAQRLETLAGLNHYAFGINDAGWVVGYVSLPAGDQAFVFDGVEATLLGTLGGFNSYAYAINSLGFVVGSSTMADEAGRHAMVWNGIELLDLNALMPAPNGWELEEARAINDQRVITGWGLLHGNRRAFLFNQGAVTDLGTLAEGRASRGLGINNVGEVVGTADIGPKQRAFVWRNGQMHDLNDFIAQNSGWELREARGINDGGEIVGWGSVKGQEHAFLLVPQIDAQSSQREKNSRGKGGSPPPSDITFTLASGGSSTPVTNSPLADAHVQDGGSAGSNFGSATLMELQTSSTSGNNRDVYFKFPIDNAPMPIGTAKLRVFTSLAANGSVITTTYSVSDTNWVESGTGSITWNTRPALGSALANATFNVKAGASYDIDVTSFVRAEQNAGRGIITLAFHCTNNTSPLASVSSKENGTAANRPVLVLNTNAFPTVSISSPANNASFPAPTNLAITATASDSDGTATNVDFYAGSYLIGRDATSPFSFTWTNAPVGTYALKAVAYDEFGAVGTSAVVNITITTNVVPLEDAHVKSDSASSNFGLATQMEVQTNGASGPTRDAYMKFSLVGVTNISSAKIRIFAAKSSGNGSVSGTYYSVADTNWAENLITWNNKPPVSNALSHVSVSGTTLVWYTNDVTSFVQGESAAGRLLITLALHSQTNNSTFIKFNSRNTNASLPELVITTTNSAPAVAISSPANNAVFVAPATIPITATASDNESVAQVEFFAGSTSLGVDTSSPYSVTWSNAAAGSYVLTARATDLYGLVSTSAVINITVDQRPTVSLTAPAGGASFPAYPTNITLTASASDSDGSVTNVEFLAGSTSLGNDATSPYSLTWNSVSVGAYTLTARATDNLGVSSTSAPVTITVDQPPTVSITNPTTGSTFTLLTNIAVSATAADADGTISQVDFYAGTIWIGASQTSPYTITWSNALAGTFALTAKATDNLGGVTTSSPVYITNRFSPTNLAGVRLWLDAGTGVTTNGAGQVSLWADQSGNANHATQNTSANQPLIVTNALNGRPVVRFDAVNDVFTFQGNPLLGTTQAEAFIVLKAGADMPAASRGLWSFGGTFSGSISYPYSDGTIWDDFDSYNIQSVGDPAQPLNQYHLYNASSRANEWLARFNGVLQYYTTNNIVRSNSAPTLGKSVSYYFDGDVAEVLIYNRVLGEEERDAVGRYLGSKYAFVSLPATPTNLTARAISSNQISVAWSAAITNAATKFVLERKAGTGGIYGTIAVLDNNASYLDSTVAASVEYFYRVKAVNYAGESDYSNEAGATPVAGATSMPLNELTLWLKGDAGHGPGAINLWADQSGQRNDAVQTVSSQRPQVIDGALNGRPVVRFDAVNDVFTFRGNPLLGTTQAEAFVVVKAGADMPAASRGLWSFGATSSGSISYPYNDGTIWDDFDSYNIQSVGDPAQPLDQYHLYNVSSRIGEWTARFNGLLQHYTTNNTVRSNSAPTLGKSISYYFDGDVAEVLIYSRVLAADERNAVGTYLNDKYKFVPLLPSPIQLAAYPLSSSQIALSWQQSGANTSATYIVERRLGTSGPFQTLALLSGDFHLIDTGLAPQAAYTYRIKPALVVDPAGYSNEASVNTPALGAAFPLGSVGLWLRAEDILGTNNGAVATWPDYRWTGQAAAQSDSAARPVWIASALNGRPAVRFGSGSFLELPTALSNDMPAEIFVVLKSSTNSPATNQGLWRFNTNAATYYPTTGGGVQDGFGSTNARSLVAPLPDLTVPAIYDVAAATNLWRARLQGPVKQLLLTNTVQFSGQPLLGRSTQGAAQPFAGDIAELIIFSRVLAFEEQKVVRDSLAQKYGITLELPHIPSGLSLVRTNVYESLLTWTALSGSENGLESIFAVERQSGTNSPFVPLQTLGRTATSYLDTYVLPEVNYFYRLSVVNDVGMVSSAALNAALPDTDNDGLPDYLESQLGTNPNSSDTDGDGLPDAWEFKYGLNPRSSTGRDGAAGDFDNDGLSNLTEYQQGTNPADGTVGEDPLIRLRVYRPN